MENTQRQPDQLYSEARRILQANPGMGKGKLAHLLGIKTPTSRRLLERYRGETEGHGTHPDYIHWYLHKLVVMQLQL